MPFHVHIVTHAVFDILILEPTSGSIHNIKSNHQKRKKAASHNNPFIYLRSLSKRSIFCSLLLMCKNNIPKLLIGSLLHIVHYLTSYIKSCILYRSVKHGRILMDITILKDAVMMMNRFFKRETSQITTTCIHKSVHKHIVLMMMNCLKGRKLRLEMIFYSSVSLFRWLFIQN